MKPVQREVHELCRFGEVRLICEAFHYPLGSNLPTKTNYWVIHNENKTQIAGLESFLGQLRGLLKIDNSQIARRYPLSTAICLAEILNLGNVDDHLHIRELRDALVKGLGREPDVATWEAGVLRFSVSCGDTVLLRVYYDSYEFDPATSALTLIKRQLLP